MIKTFITRYKWHLIALGAVLLIAGIFTLVNSNRRLKAKYNTLNEELIKHRTETIRLKSELIETQIINAKYDRQIDSLSKIVEADQEEINKLKKKTNDKIKSVNNWSANDRQFWFDDVYPRTGN